MKRSKYSESQVVFALKQAELEQENHQLKKLVADLSLDKHMLQEVLKKKL